MMMTLKQPLTFSFALIIVFGLFIPSLTFASSRAKMLNTIFYTRVADDRSEDLAGERIRIPGIQRRAHSLYKNYRDARRADLILRSVDESPSVISQADKTVTEEEARRDALPPWTGHFSRRLQYGYQSDVEKGLWMKPEIPAKRKVIQNLDRESQNGARFRPDGELTGSAKLRYWYGLTRYPSSARILRSVDQ